MATITFGQDQLPAMMKIIPLSALVVEFAEDTYRFELIESDSSLSVTLVGEATDRGIDRATAVLVEGTAVVMHNAYADADLRTAMRRMARESDAILSITVEAKAIAGQAQGAQMDITAMTGEIEVADIGTGPWTVEWITTERPRLSIPISGVLSIDALDDYEDEEENTFSKLFSHISGYD